MKVLKNIVLVFYQKKLLQKGKLLINQTIPNNTICHGQKSLVYTVDFIAMFTQIEGNMALMPQNRYKAIRARDKHLKI